MSISPIQREEPLSKFHRTEEEEVKVEQKEPDHPFETLSIAIQFQLDEAQDPKTCAENIAQLNPDLLFQISAYTPEAFLALFDNERAAFKSTLRILYTTALRNSNYNQIATYLDKNIVEYIPLSKKTYMKILIQEAENLLKKENNSMQCIQLVDKIEKVLNLFYYIDPNVESRIINLYTHTPALLFSNCKRNFSTLARNLKTCQDECCLLRNLRGQLTQRILLDLQHRKVVEPSTYQRFCSNYTIPLYDAGLEFLTDCTKLTLQLPNLPPEFKDLKQLSNTRSFHSFSLNPKLTPNLIWDLSCRYLNKDINEFMESFIQHLSDDDPFFESIKTTITPKEVILEALKKKFPEATWISLKESIS